MIRSAAATREDPAASYLSIRFDPYTDEPGDRHSTDDIVIHYNTTTPPAKIREQLKRDFVHPELERIATLRVAGQSVRVYGIYIPGGDHSYVAEVVRAWHRYFHGATVDDAPTHAASATVAP